MRTYYEFFAGGGMARAGLGAGWKCLFANDVDLKKVESYRANWGDEEILHSDINDVETSQMPGRPDLVWASFPCQDLSLAGGGAGLKGNRSGTFWPFWQRIEALAAEGRRPAIVALENVTGMLSSHKGKDFQAICEALRSQGYRFGAVVVDAAHFVPQSRKRVFIVAISQECELNPSLVAGGPNAVWHPKPLQSAMERLPESLRQYWVWWSLPAPGVRNEHMIDVYEDEPAGVVWHKEVETQKLLSMMSDRNRQKLQNAREAGTRVVGTLYRRTRPSPEGGVQRAELRIDGTAGCLRTPAGGSSRQVVICADDRGIRSRLISPREAARLMGLSNDYHLPSNYNDAYHLMGDGLAVPAVSFLSENLLKPVTERRLLKAA